MQDQEGQGGVPVMPLLWVLLNAVCLTSAVKQASGIVKGFLHGGTGTISPESASWAALLTRSITGILLQHLKLLGYMIWMK